MLPIHVLILGHSFIRCVHDFLCHNSNTHIAKKLSLDGDLHLTLVEPDICKTYAHAIDLLCWTMFQLCYVHYYLCINYVTYHIT